MEGKLEMPNISPDIPASSERSLARGGVGRAGIVFFALLLVLAGALLARSTGIPAASSYVATDSLMGP
jgi:hypothetical protein